MKISSMVTIALATAGLAGYSGASLADAAAGKATFEKACAECHEVGDFKGEDAKELAGKIDQIAAGKLKHKKPIKLSAAEAADVAAYMSAGK
jgi:mono/diheme cytochrome c family protein